MSTYTVAKKTKLTFKGEKKEKTKKKHKSKEKHELRDVEELLEGWVPVLSSEDFEGPLLIVAVDETNKDKPHALTLKINKSSYSDTGQITRETVYLGLAAVSTYPADPEAPGVSRSLGLLGASVRYEPASVEQVFVGQRISLRDRDKGVDKGKDEDKDGDGDGDGDQYVLKTCRGSYLSVGPNRAVAAESVAISSNELWTLILRTDTKNVASGLVTFRANPDSQQPHFLSANSGSSAKPSPNISLDNKGGSAVHTSIASGGVGQVFMVFCQAEIRNERTAAAAAAARANSSSASGLGSSGDLAQEEIEQIKKFQSWKHGNAHIQTDSLDKRALKRAKASGKYHEELLDRRAKLKSDKFC